MVASTSARSGAVNTAITNVESPPSIVTLPQRTGPAGVSAIPDGAADSRIALTTSESAARSYGPGSPPERSTANTRASSIPRCTSCEAGICRPRYSRSIRSGLSNGSAVVGSTPSRANVRNSSSSCTTSAFAVRSTSAMSSVRSVSPSPNSTRAVVRTIQPTMRHRAGIDVVPPRPVV